MTDPADGFAPCSPLTEVFLNHRIWMLKQSMGNLSSSDALPDIIGSGG